MTDVFEKEIRVLALDPSNKGFGYAVLEGPEKLIDWGVKGSKNSDKKQRLDQLANLIEQYEPDVVVVEDYSRKGSRRGSIAKEFIRTALTVALIMEINSRTFSRADIRKAFSQVNARTKHAIATEITKRFPELTPRIPPVRKPWMSEDYRMSIFDAISLGWTYFFFRLNASGNEPNNMSK